MSRRLRTLVAATAVVALSCPALHGWAEDDQSPTPGPTPVASAAPSALPDDRPPAETPTQVAPTDSPEPSAQPSSEPSASPSPTALARAPQAAARAAAVRVSVGVAPAKMLGHATNAWGSVAGAPAGSVIATEYLDARGVWRRDGTTRLRANGSFVLPLYQSFDAAGSQTWRVVCEVAGHRSTSQAVSQYRFRRPVTGTAGVKVVNIGTNVWGSFDTKRALDVWTEVRLDGGRWQRSQQRVSSSRGDFVIPLTYGRERRGVWHWRVAADYGTGYVVRSAEFTLRRVAAPTATTAGSKLIGLGSNVWGHFDGPAGLPVRTEVSLPGVGWRTSQTGRTDSRGNYVLPLTYGINTPGTWRFRVVATYPEGTVRTGEVRLLRVAGANATITPTKSAELAGYHHSGCPMKPSRLRTVQVNYYDYSGQIRRGAIVVRGDRAGDVASAFTQMFNAKFRIARMELPTRWKGSDEQMMAANNTSGYNCRKVVGNPYRWSPHAYGYAVDINPVQNPYRDPSGKWWPSSQYSTKRPAGVVGMHYRSSASVRALTSRGWKWGEGWDWHHFERR